MLVAWEGKARLVYQETIGVMDIQMRIILLQGVLSDCKVDFKDTHRLLRVSASGSNIYLPVVVFGLSFLEGVRNEARLCFTVANELVDHDAPHEDVGRV